MYKSRSKKFKLKRRHTKQVFYLCTIYFNIMTNASLESVKSDLKVLHLILYPGKSSIERIIFHIKVKWITKGLSNKRYLVILGCSKVVSLFVVLAGRYMYMYKKRLKNILIYSRISSYFLFRKMLYKILSDL